MHIPDGYLSPETYITSYAVGIPLFIYGIKKLKENLSEETIPFISTLTALSFLIMMINIPIPGGTSGHAIGTTSIAILFNPWVAFVSVSLVLLIQALLFGDGGITTWAVESIAMGFVSAFVGFYSFKIFKKFLNESFSLFICGWISIVSASLVVSIVLGIQPYFFHDEQGKPLFFPFDLKITVPAIVGSHMLYFGVVEGIYTVLVVKFIEKIKSSFGKVKINES